MPSPTAQRGYVLILTLWLLAIITIGASYFAEKIGHALAQAEQAQTASQALIEIFNTRAEVFYRLGVSGFSASGLGASQASAIALDNSPYRGDGQSILRLQDNRGLININYPDLGLVRGLLGMLGVPVDQHESLLDKLQDYTDTDDLHRLNGAEADEYARRGLLPPANDFLRNPFQLRGILGWRDTPQLWQNQRLPSLISTNLSLGINPNTAPAELLAILPGGSTALAEAVIQRRRQQAFLSVAELAPFSDQPALLSVDQLIFFPASGFRLTLQHPGLPWAYLYNVTLTPAADAAPWRVDYYLQTSAIPLLPSENDIRPLPPVTAPPVAPTL